VSGHHMEVLPLSAERWIVRYEGDPTPLAQTSHRVEAIAEARLWARNFGEPLIHVHGLDGSCETVEVQPEFPAPTSADVPGPHVEPGRG
jgi:hypothetical protein